ncbi:MAG: carboxypeptidase regulatory-like domain-containing protein, partial [Ignavibacteria bacterium]
MKTFVTTFLLPFVTTCVVAQSINIKGKVVQSADASPVPGAAIKLVSVKDSTQTRGGYAERDGAFSIKEVPFGAYRLSISAIGFRKLESTVFVREGKNDVGTFRMQIDTVKGSAINVEATAIRMEVKGDTMDYNAQAFKTNPNATAEDLVKKMPGITVENGTVKAQGEEVRRVTVDGREFFGDDAQATLRNLPADMVDRVQVFDRGSDLSMFSGFDDGNTSKQMNVVTRKDKRNGSFGRLYAGYGDQDRYQAGATINNFSGPQRISLIGMANNVNQQNFSFQDILGTMGGGGGMSGGMGRMM